MGIPTCSLQKARLHHSDWKRRVDRLKKYVSRRKQIGMDRLPAMFYHVFKNIYRNITGVVALVKNLR